MIKIRTAYDLYNKYLAVKIEEYNAKAAVQKERISIYHKELAKIRPFIENYINYGNLLNGKLPELPVDFKDAIVNFGYSNIVVKNYYILYKTLIKYEEEIQSLNKQKISFPIYKTIITKFNEGIIEYCLNTGKPYTNKHFGTFRVYHRENADRTPNWGKSREKKQQIIDAGGILYNANDEELAIKEGREYKGEKWIVKGFENGLLYWKWYVPEIVKQEVKRETYNYKFVPAKGNFGAMSRLKKIYATPNYDYSIYEQL